VQVLESLCVPLVHWPNGHIYFNVSSLELAFAFVTRFGGKGLVAPNSLKSLRTKRCDRHFPTIDPKDIERFAREVKVDVTTIAAHRRSKIRHKTRTLLGHLASSLEQQAIVGNAPDPTSTTHE
jgi:hypothetical protein